jgi:iron complex transport system substrate-binding protein
MNRIHSLALTATLIVVVMISAIVISQYQNFASEISSSPTPSPSASPANFPLPTSTPVSSPTPSLSPSPSSSASPSPAPVVSPTPAPTPSPFPVTVLDDEGRSVTMQAAPDRIVALAPSCTEILFGIGLGDKIVGAVTYSAYPSEIQQKIAGGNITSLGSFAKVSVEAVVSLNPDLVVITGGYQSALAYQLDSLGLKLAIVSPKGFQGVLADISMVGKLTGQVSAENALVTTMSSRAQAIASMTKDVSKPRVYVEYYFSSSGFGSYGAASFVNDLISMAGGVNLFAGFGVQYVTTSAEVIIEANPEVIVISKGAMSGLAGITPESIKARPAWNETSAVQNNKIYVVNEELITIGGPRIIDGLEQMARAIHPELFSSSS